MNILGVVLARKGSKGIKNKNRLKLKGKNLVELSMLEARNSKKINKLILSTDDRFLRNKLKKLDFDVPFLRPKKFSSDKASSFSVLRHATNWLRINKNWEADIVVLLQPTTPFRTSDIIDRVINKLISSKADAALTITDADYPPHWMFYKKKDKLKLILKNGNKFTRRQDTPKIYKPSGMVYALKTKFLKKIKGLLPQGKTVGVYVDPDISVNIDNFNQYLLAKIKCN